MSVRLHRAAGKSAGETRPAVSEQVDFRRKPRRARSTRRSQRFPPPRGVPTPPVTDAAAASTAIARPKPSGGGSCSAAATARRRRSAALRVSVPRGMLGGTSSSRSSAARYGTTKETFSGYWGRWLDRRRPYLEPGTWSGYEIAGRKRLLPAFGGRPLGELSVDAIVTLSPSLPMGPRQASWQRRRSTTHSGRSGSASTRRSRIACSRSTRRCACSGSRQRTSSASTCGSHEIPRYLDACSDVYRPLAELLVGSGLRISEALALRIGD